MLAGRAQARSVTLTGREPSAIQIKKQSPGDCAQVKLEADPRPRPLPTTLPLLLSELALYLWRDSWVSQLTPPYPLKTEARTEGPKTRGRNASL